MGTTPSNPMNSGMFAPPPVEKTFPVRAFAIAAVAIMILTAFLVVWGRRRPEPLNAIQPLAAYAPHLEFSGVEMSESTSLSGGKSTYIDGHVTNHGPSTVSGVTVQVLFANDEKMPPQVETLPLALIRSREPYVDTQPISANPLGPGAEREFRLIFENIGSNWNQHLPEIHVVAVKTK